MKIDSVLLENFGLYGGKRFRFDGQPLVLIYGANESGKTTALNGLRQALFGFPHNSPYLTGKPMSAEVNVTLSDGRTVRFTRQKKRADAFAALIDGKIPLVEARWQELAGGLDLKTYQSLFGFSLEELRSGEKALAHAPLSEALSGSGFGGLARLQQVQERIETFLAATLKRTGNAGAINAKLAEIEAAEKQLESVATLPSDVEALRQRFSAAGQTVEQLGARLAELRAELESCQRRQSALPRANELRQIEHALREHEIPAAIDEDFRLQWTLTQNRLAATRSELIVEQQKLADLELRLHALPNVASDGAAGANVHAEEIRRLATVAQQIAGLRRQVADESREAEELERELGESLRRIGLSKQDRQWTKIQLDLAQRAELDGARLEHESISTRLAACRTRLEVTSDQLRKQSAASSAEEIPENLDQLDALVREALPVVQSCQQMSVRLDELRNDKTAAARRDRLQRATQKFVPTASDPDFQLSDQWSVPSTGDVARHQQLLSQAATHHQRLAAEMQRCQSEAAQLRSELGAAHAVDGLTTIEHLQTLWQRRDRIVAEWLEELQTPLLAARISLEDQLGRLSAIAELNSEADRSVLGMLASADRLAQLVSQQSQLERLEQRSAALAAQLEQAQAALETQEHAWRGLWCGCPLEPESPEALGSWLEDYRNWCEQQATLRRMTDEHQRLVARAEEALQKVLAAWPQRTGRSVPPADCSLSDLQHQVQRWRAASAARAVQNRLMQELAVAQAEATHEQADLERRLQECVAHYRQTSAALNLPESWPIHELGTRLDAFARCQALSARIERIRQRTRAVQSQLDGFAMQVGELARLSGWADDPPPGDLPELQALSWLEQLQQAEQAERQRTDLKTAIAAHMQTIAKRSAQIVESEQGLQRMAESAGAQTLDQVQAWIGSANTVFQLRAKKSQVTAALEASAGEIPLDDFLNELSSLDPQSLTAAAASLSAQVASAEQSRQAAIQEQGALVRELEYKEQGSAAMECEQRLKRLRSELVELSEQWVVHRLAGDLLQRTIDRFTRDHEPQLLRHTRRFFRDLTDGRYCVVEHDSGKHGGFAVRDQQGHAWQPDKLSTGTREQLYLAIRLAFITHFNEQHEPLPVIMDDCFVNFDDLRARLALRTLIRWRESVQTILLSCHWRSVEALAELAPETPVITIANGEVTPARLLADRAEDQLATNPVLRLPF